MADRSLTDEVHEVAAQFPLKGDLVEARPYGSGHIHRTLAVRCGDERYVFQQINQAVFKDVPLLMENVWRVVAHLRTKASPVGGRRFLDLVLTTDNRSYVELAGSGCWRVFRFIGGTRSVDWIESPRQAFEVGRAFGTFQEALADLPGGRLRETIPDFHHTRRRFENLAKAAREDREGRASEVTKELDLAAGHERDVDVLSDLAAAGEVPERVTHNDTKVNNVLLDEVSGRGICVIDLDTVMPGLSLYDFGDMVRSAANTAFEDEQDLASVGVNVTLFESLTAGFTEGTGGMLNRAEWDHLVFSVKLMALELGMRFLTDYLEGDVYFRTTRPKQNLDRCRVQFRLLECLEQRENELQGVVRALEQDLRRSGVQQ